MGGGYNDDLDLERCVYYQRKGLLCVVFLQFSKPIDIDIRIVYFYIPIFNTHNQMPDNPNNPFQFWQELKRRKVVRVIIVYAAASFVILELVDIVSPSLRLPEWTMNFIIVLLCAGFIITVILSWVYDITPEGIEKTNLLMRLKRKNPKNDLNY